MAEKFRIARSCEYCGAHFEAVKSKVLAGFARFCSQSCRAKACVTQHGHNRDGRHSPTYASWRSMRQRCGNPNDPKYNHYGGRGIAVCEEWRTFAGFLRDMGERPVGTSLDRIDNDGDYCPANCRWATQSEQCRNMRVTAMVTYRGAPIAVADLADHFGLAHCALKHRIKVGWPEDRWGEPSDRANRAARER